jgi:hypothetical protein
MSIKRSRASLSLAATALLALSGCGGPKFDYAEVEGTVTLNNKPLSGVLVRFVPRSDGKEQLPSSSGTTDDAGRFKLTHHGSIPGALVGSHCAVVRRPNTRDEVKREPIPAHYSVVDESPLTVTVKAGPRQTIDLALEGE